ncbi:MAG: polymer-forming cytoskeletal protein [Spirochaetota bacterium]|nr:polymer-forming cytoskeletal protein [Spirochaetota bacterium]
MLSKADSYNSAIGGESYFNGRFMVRGSLRVDGKFEGEVLEVEQLFIGPKGKLKTNIFANIVNVEGLVIGNIIAKNRVFLHPSSKVLGDIKTKELIIQNGVILEGNCQIGNNFNESPRELLLALFHDSA